MKTLTLTAFRAEPGERIRDVAREGESFVLTKSGKPVALLCPIRDDTIIHSDGRIEGPMPLTFRRDL